MKKRKASRRRVLASVVKIDTTAPAWWWRKTLKMFVAKAVCQLRSRRDWNDEEARVVSVGRPENVGRR